MKTVHGALDRRLDPASCAPIALALSGGGDSLALLHMTMEWAQEHGRQVLALTVDHGLNPRSADWTAYAGARARALGAQWQALTWQGAKPDTGIQVKARAARHALLAEAARTAGASVILMGHTADDVAEGELMREREARGMGRLREWSPSPAWPEGRRTFLLRPLLSVGRAELRTYLAAKDAAWLDDPANEDRRFARVRARQALNSAHGRADRDRRLLAVEEGVTGQAGVCGSAAASRAVAFDETGVTAPTELPGAALAALLLCISGGATPPRGADLARLQAVIAKGGVATLCGCRVEARSAHLRIAREPPRRGRVARSAEPVAWVEQRYRAACGLYPDEASIPPPT